MRQNKVSFRKRLIEIVDKGIKYTPYSNNFTNKLKMFGNCYDTGAKIELKQNSLH